MAPTRLTVVLVGQTGNGKSATGNSLLGREAFVARRSLQSVTERCRVRYAALDADDEPIVPGDPAVGVDEDAGGIRRPSTVLRVVDTPGTCDSGALLEDNLRHISAFLRGEERVDESTADDDDDDDGAEAGAGDEGLHALVLVLSAATRFTQEEAVALERLVQRLAVPSPIALARAAGVAIGLPAQKSCCTKSWPSPGGGTSGVRRKRAPSAGGSRPGAQGQGANLPCVISSSHATPRTAPSGRDFRRDWDDLRTPTTRR